MLLVLPQSSATEPIDIPVFGEAERLGFDFRAFADQYGFDGAQGGGAHMWREVWDETVSHIYTFTLSAYMAGFAVAPVLTGHRISQRKTSRSLAGCRSPTPTRSSSRRKSMSRGVG